ncbi:MAG TPA: hypothetical protein VJH89_02330 [Patescibacteria group bacterium]|nr:hypothetical protein [Patescibacteria group bacterium]
MKNKVRTAIFSLVVFGLAPFATFAQWNPFAAGRSNLPAGPSNGIYGIVEILMLWILGIFGFIGIIGFVISGILYLTAAGDETRMERAKNAMIYSIIGVIVGLMGLVIIFAVNNWLSGRYTRF